MVLIVSPFRSLLGGKTVKIGAGRVRPELSQHFYLLVFTVLLGFDLQNGEKSVLMACIGVKRKCNACLPVGAVISVFIGSSVPLF